MDRSPVSRRGLDFGLGLRARHPSMLAVHSRQAEDAGFSHIWLYDSPRCAEPYVSLPYCAMATSRAVVGMAVTNTRTRDPTVVANGFATLAILTGGRVKFGLGLGDSAVKFIGRKPSRFDAFGESVDIVQALLRGETVPYNGRRLTLPAVPDVKPALLLAAEGPRTFALAGAAAEGAIISPGGSPRFLRYAIGRIREGAVRAGRDPEALHVCAWTHCVVDQTTEQAMHALAPEVGRTLVKAALRIPPEVLGASEPLLSPKMRDHVLQEATRQDHEYDLARTLRSTLGDELFREMTLAGTPDDCARKIDELRGVDGLSQLIINVYGRNRELALKTLGSEAARRPSTSLR